MQSHFTANSCNITYSLEIITNECWASWAFSPYSVCLSLNLNLLSLSLDTSATYLPTDLRNHNPVTNYHCRLYCKNAPVAAAAKYGEKLKNAMHSVWWNRSLYVLRISLLSLRTPFLWLLPCNTWTANNSQLPVCWRDSRFHLHYACMQRK